MKTPTVPTCLIGPTSSLVRVNCVPLIMPVSCMGEVSSMYPEPDVICLLDIVNSTFTFTMVSWFVAVIIHVMVRSSVPKSFRFSKSS